MVASEIAVGRLSAQMLLPLTMPVQRQPVWIIKYF